MTGRLRLWKREARDWLRERELGNDENEGNWRAREGDGY